MMTILGLFFCLFVCLFLSFLIGGGGRGEGGRSGGLLMRFKFLTWDLFEIFVSLAIAFLHWG